MSSNNEQANRIDKWIAEREEFKSKVASIMEEGKDYHIIQGRKSLSKGGAEKIASLFKWVATFTKDEEVLSIIDQTTDKHVAFVCYLSDYDERNSHLQPTSVVGQGRGAASLRANKGDVNKWIKMAQKSAFIDAVLRTSGLSDSYTQDLEDMDPSHIGEPNQPSYQATNSYTPDKPAFSTPGKPSPKQMQTITEVMDRKNITVEDLFDAGFPALTELTGGREGTASELIDWLFKEKQRPFKETPTQQKLDTKPASFDEVDVSDIPF